MSDERHAAWRGATLVDLRPPAEFASGHARGALSLPFSARGLARRLAVVLPAPARLVLVAPDVASAEAARAQLGEGGYEVEDVVGPEAVPAQASLETVDVSELAHLATDGRATVIDVREPEEWATGHVPGALLISLGRLRDELDRVPRGRRAVVICEAGVRSCTGASILLAAERTDVAHVPAGTSGYRRAGLPLVFTTPEELRP